MSASGEPSPDGVGTASGRSSSSFPTLGSAERALLGAIAGAPPIDPRRLGLFAGDRLGRYEIVRELGRGGMGVVFLARDTLLEREVALKVLAPEAGSGSEVAARVIREARASSRLAHPSIARVFDVGEDAGLVFLAMEHVPGGTLRSWMRGRARVAPREAASIGASIARALAAAHRAGIVHRDLKPENVIVADDGRVCVVDFGLAQRLETEAAASPGPRASRAAGTPGYLAPELAAGARADARSDLFSLGVILRELVPASSDASRDGARFERVVGRLLQTDPRRREGDAGRVAAALAEVAARRPSRARRVFAGLTAAALVIGAAVGLSVYRRDPPPARAPAALERLSSVLSTSPLAIAPPSIACPPFTATGVAAPRAWLGAAAASLACRRLAMTLGDPEPTTLGPARLLDASPSPVETDEDVDPWADDEVVRVAAQHAEARAAIVLDGEVEVSRGGFRVALGLRDVTTGARGGAGSTWHRIWTSPSRGRSTRGSPSSARTARPISPKERGHDTASLIGQGCSRSTISGRRSIRTPPSTTPGSVPSAPVTAAVPSGVSSVAGSPTSSIDRPPPATTMARGRSGHATSRACAPRPTRSLRRGRPAASRWSRAESPTRSRPRLRSALVPATSRRAASCPSRRSRSIPRQGPGRRWSRRPTRAQGSAAWGARTRPGIRRRRMRTTWRRQDARARTAEVRVRLLERAHLLSSGAPLYAGNYGRALLLAGRPEQARAVAARLHTGSATQGFAGDRLDAEVQLSEGRVAGAFETLLDLLRRVPSVGSVERGDAVALGLAAELATLLGREDELAELATSRFVEDERRIVGGAFAASVLVQACVLARPAIARPCVERLVELDASGHFREGATPDGAPFLEGALRWVRGDVRGAASSFRLLAGRVGFGQRPLVARALEASGDLDAADRLDDPSTTRGLFGGVSPSDARAAIRAHRRGDPRAKAMAKKVLDAWAGADARLVLTSELEAIAR